MFRVTKKRSKSARVRLLDDHDHDDSDNDDGKEEQVQLIVDRKKVKKQKATNRKSAVRSLDEPDDDETQVELEDSTASIPRKSNKRRKKSGGLGFGGSAVADPNEDDTDGVTGAYDRDALSKLLAEQNSYVKPQEKVEPPLVDIGSPPSGEEDHSKERAPVLPEYVPLSNSRSEPLDTATILTGDEAFSYAEQQQQQLRRYFDDDDDDEGDEKRFAFENQQQQQEEDSGDDWEAELTRRAGILPSSSSSTKATTSFDDLSREATQDSSNELMPAASGKSAAMLEQLRTQIQETVGQLEVQQGDMLRRIERRKGEIETNNAAVQRHETDLSEAGSALEFYQKWRNDLIEWVGAMRELRTKVEPILVALHELEGEKSALQRWQEWENDTIAVLQEHGVLEQVIGRQPPPTAIAPVIEATVDEFGRDVKSQHVMRREKRRNHRRQIHQQRQSGLSDGCLIDDHDSNNRTVVISNPDFIRGDESDAFVSDGEKETFRERDKALRKALAVAMDDLREEYTSLQNLVNLFEEWRSAYPGEYKQCFASLSLADLAGILVQAELCALNDPWNESGGYNEAKWTAVVHLALEKGTLDQAAVERLLQKWVFPTIADLLDKTGINLTSSRQTRSLSEFVSYIQKLVPLDSPVWRKVHKLLTAYVAQSLADMAIPIVGKTAHSPRLPIQREELDEARYAATQGQLHRLKKTLENLLVYWAPIMQNYPQFCDLILHFISNKFLFLLSSLKGTDQDGLAETPAEVFRAVFQSLSKVGWLDSPECILQAAPIRAAAAVYYSNDL